jgi:hypothetical protein
MSKTFKPRPLETEELNRALSSYAGTIPTVTAPVAASTSARTRIVQVNFKCSEGMAETIARLGREAGSTRRFLARLLVDAGHPVPECDVNPPDPRKRGQG